MNRYEQVEIDGEKLLSVEVLEKIREGEDMLGIGHIDVEFMSNEQLAMYLKELRHKYKQSIEPGGRCSGIELPSNVSAVQEPTDAPEGLRDIVEAQETQAPELQTQNDEHKKDESIQEAEQEQVSQPIAAVATTATDTPSEEVAFILACAYRWLTSINMSERNRVQFQAPPAFEYLATMGLIDNIPSEAEWTCWNRLHAQ